MQKPIIFPAIDFDINAFAQKTGASIIDTYDEQLKDLFFIRNPRYRFDKNYQVDLDDFLNLYISETNLKSKGNWVYFSWNNLLVHYLPHEEHFEVRTARNKNIITIEEQQKYYDLRIAVAGLSVGSHGVLTTALAGGARTMKLADMDVIGPSNLNRLRFDFTMIGKHKGEALTEYLYQLNPYAEITLYKEGVNEDNISDFLENIDVLVEELDDLSIKMRLREEARKRRIPVIMATDSSDNVILDIERFDLHPNMPIFHGALRGMDLSNLKVDPAKLFEAMGRIIDLRLITERQLETVKEIGKTIYSWPQLATAATASGAVLAYALRRIAIKSPLVEGKHKLNLDALLDPNYKRTMRRQRRTLSRFKKAMKIPNGMLSVILMLWRKIFFKR